MIYLREATQSHVILGPIISAVDFVTPKTDLAYNGTGIDCDLISLAAGTKADVSLAAGAGDGYWRHLANGYYAVTIPATSLTAGSFRLTINATGFLATYQDIVVLDAVAWDTLIAGTGAMGADMTKIGGNSVADNTATLKLKKLDITNPTESGSPVVIANGESASPAVQIVALTAGADGVIVNAAGVGVSVRGGSGATATKQGLLLRGGGTVAGNDLELYNAKTNLWSVLTSALTTVGSLGKLFVDYLNDSITSRASQTSVDALTGVVSEGIPHYYYPDASSALVYGTVGAGTYANLASRDDSVLELREVTGANPLEYIAEFVGIVADHIPGDLAITGRYEGSTTGHNVAVQIWNYATGTWITKLTMVHRTTNFDYASGLTAENVSGGAARVRFVHSAVSGTASHRLYLDRVQIGAVEATNQSAVEIAAILAMVNDIDLEVDEIESRLPAGIIAGEAELAATEAAILAAFSATTNLGEGAESVVLKLTRAITAAPIANAEVWITSDEEGLNVVAGTVLTDELGETPVFLLDPGTYYRWAAKVGENFTNPLAFTVTPEPV